MLHVLLAAGTAPATGRSSGGSGGKIAFIIFGIVFVLISLLNVLKPDLSFRMNRWQYKNKEAWEPSNGALIAARVSGCIGVVVGIVLIVVGLNR